MSSYSVNQINRFRWLGNDSAGKIVAFHQWRRAGAMKAR